MLSQQGTWASCPSPPYLSALMTGCPEAGRERAKAFLHHTSGGACAQPHSHHPSWGRQSQGTISLQQGHPVAKASFQEEKGLREASLPQMLAMKIPLDLFFPQLTRLWEVLLSLFSLPFLFPFFPVSLFPQRVLF